jgi:hypothetical protein
LIGSELSVGVPDLLGWTDGVDGWPLGTLLGFELGLVVGLSLGEMDILGWIDGVVVGWSVVWSDFIDGWPFGALLGREL